MVPWQKPMTERDKQILAMPGWKGYFMRNPLKCCIGLLILFSLALSMIHPKTVTPDQCARTPHIGDECQLNVDSSGSDVILAVNQEACHEMCTANSDHELAVMVLNGSCFFAPKGTRAKLLDWGEGHFEVLVLDGPTIGRKGWVPDQFVQVAARE